MPLQATDAIGRMRRLDFGRKLVRKASQSPELRCDHVVLPRRPRKAAPRPVRRPRSRCCPTPSPIAGGSAAALIALIVASAATLVVPLAVRRMVDFGFSNSNAGLIRSYFLGDDRGRRRARARLRRALLSRHDARRSGWSRICAPNSSPISPGSTRRSSTPRRPARSSPACRPTRRSSRRHSARLASIALRNFFMFIGAVAMMVVTSPKLSAYVLAAIPIIVLPLFAAGRAVRERSRRAQDTLAEATAFAAESLSAVRVMQSFVAEAFTAGRYRNAAYGAYEAARGMAQARAIVTTAALFLAFGSVVVVLWLGAQDVVAGRMSGGALTAVRALRRARRGRARTVVGSLERGVAGRRRRGPHRRTAGRQAAIAAPAAPLALAIRCAANSRSVRSTSPIRAATEDARPARRQLPRRAGRSRRHRRPVRRGQVDALPAGAALLRSRARAR